MANTINNSIAYRINFSENTPKQADDAYNMPLEHVTNTCDTYEHCTYLTDLSNSDFVEGYLNSHGINFVKIPQSVALAEENVIKRTVLPKIYQNDNEHSIVLLNMDKFEQYYKNDDFYLPYDSNSPQYKGVMEYLKTGEDFEAPSVDIYENKNGLAISFQDGRHRYATLRELGFKNVPVCLDKNSIKLAKKYGLISE